MGNGIVNNVVSVLVEWLEYPTSVQEGPGPGFETRESQKTLNRKIRWML